ncbi:MAG: SDR family NAD(P)-dependent oxidoreductase [Planctomycetota bacterium]|jgi:NAD(P)-dependent dehydrogenase (short-subunit alcohol dehydrogenase family)
MASSETRPKVAIVTGAGSGIGRALSDALARRNVHVVLADRDAEAVAAAADEISTAGGSAEAATLDVTSADGFAALVVNVKQRHGRLDWLFNNAGIGLAGEVRDLTLADWRKVVEVNVMGVVHGVQAAYPIFIEQGFGAIVNTASGAGLCPRPGMTPYATSKHAVVGLSTSLRAEAAGLGVRVIAVCPGFIRTRIMDNTEYKGLDEESLLKEIPFSGMPADRCAEKILRGVKRNRPLVIVGPLLAFEWWLYRMCPRFMIWLSGYRAKRFRAHRR